MIHNRYYPFSYNESPPESEHCVRVEHNGITYSVIRSLFPDQKEYIKVRSQLPRDGSEYNIIIELGAAREIAEAILNLLDPFLLPIPNEREKAVRFVTDAMAARNMGSRWTPAEDALLLYLYCETKTPVYRIAGYLGRTVFAINARLPKLGVKPCKEPEDSEDEDSSASAS